ncbi:Helitron helicase [Phytophthora megakarya]|uniref:Helitron helicase n=1 Tax=Phytophthora megakarya TaxID=4795 RepID=A0A225UQK6_9STRA|nr:Helitron helicase [Phytophthora megakarya]
MLKAPAPEKTERRGPGPLDPYNEEDPPRPTSTRMVSRQIHHINVTKTQSRRESVQMDTNGLLHTILIFAKMCSTVQSVKYLYKYVYKGQDRAIAVLRERGRRDCTDENNTTEERVDEIKQYLDARYLSSPEACWTIFKYEMQNKSHHAHRLPVHDEDQQHIHFPTNAQDVIAMNQLNGPGSDIARRLLYHEVSIHFVWVKMGDRYVWQPRQRGGDKSIGRLISVSSKDINLYYLHLPLCYRRRPRSFEDLKTVDGVVMETYKSAALSLGFLESDEDSQRCLLAA